MIEVDTTQKCVELTMNTDTTTLSTYEIHIEEHAHRLRRLSGDDVYFAIFAGHGLTAEWRLVGPLPQVRRGDGHRAGTSAGDDIELECVGDVDHSGHDHGRRLSGDHAAVAPTCPTPDSDGASKPAVALALAGLAGGLALFLSAPTPNVRLGPRARCAGSTRGP